jgi:hypothetical protein
MQTYWLHQLWLSRIGSTSAQQHVTNSRNEQHPLSFSKLASSTYICVAQKTIKQAWYNMHHSDNSKQSQKLPLKLPYFTVNTMKLLTEDANINNRSLMVLQWIIRLRSRNRARGWEPVKIISKLLNNAQDPVGNWPTDPSYVSVTEWPLLTRTFPNSKILSAISVDHMHHCIILLTKICVMLRDST